MSRCFLLLWQTVCTTKSIHIRCSSTHSNSIETMLLLLLLVRHRVLVCVLIHTQSRRDLILFPFSRFVLPSVRFNVHTIFFSLCDFFLHPQMHSNSKCLYIRRHLPLHQTTEKRRKFHSSSLVCFFLLNLFISQTVLASMIARFLSHLLLHSAAHCHKQSLTRLHPAHI